MMDLLRPSRSLFPFLLLAASAAACGNPSHLVGWEDDFSADRGWKREPFLVADPDPAASVVVSASGIVFRVPTPGKAMAWTRTVNPIWVSEFPSLLFDYEVSGSINRDSSGVLLLSDDSTGPITPGALNPENPLASGDRTRLFSPRPGRHRDRIDVLDEFKSDGVGRLSVIVESATGPAMVTVRRISFSSLDSTSETAFTSVQGKENIPVDVAGAGSELILTLAAQRFGSSRPWYSKRSPYSREPLASPHELLVRLEYEDGTRRSFFPRSAVSDKYVVSETAANYGVPVDPGRNLVRCFVEDRMEYGRVAVLDATLQAAAPEPSPTASSSPLKRPSDRAAVDWVAVGESAELAFTFSDGPRLHEILLKRPSPRLALRDEKGVPFLRVTDTEERDVPLSLRSSTFAPSGGSASVEFSGWLGENPFSLTLVIENANEEVSFDTTLVSESTSEIRLKVTLPYLPKVRVAPSPGNRSYLLGTRNTLLGSADVEIREPYGGSFPLQFIDFFDSESGGGMAIRVEDKNLLQKDLYFRQDANGAEVAIEIPNLRLMPGESKKLPRVVLDAHAGDWRAPFHRYRDWVRSSFPSPQGRLKDLFFCRRDYPLGGTDYLFDAREVRYTPGRLIEESESGFGGIDMIDISGWAYNERTGRVGDYLKNDIGGLEELANQVRLAEERGAKTGLYFEGYLLDRRCELAERAIPAWQLVGKNGEPRWWNGDMEFFCCPGVPEWREAFSSMVAEVAKKTGAHAVYVDEFGFGGPPKVCWNTNHNHPIPSNPLREEEAMLKRIRERLDEVSPGAALYTEQLPCDGMARLTDAAFNYGMADPSMKPRPGAHPTKLPLTRFVFPEIAVVEMIGHGIRPPAVSVDDLHLCLFHGLAVWLKGRSDSWFSPAFRSFAKKIHPIFEEHAHTFRAPDCEPLIPTLTNGVYANRFRTEEEILITLYNGNPFDVSGKLVNIEIPEGWVGRDLLAGEAAEFKRDGERVVLSGALEPHEAGVFLFSPSPPSQP